MAAARTIGPARFIALLGLVVLGVSFFLPAASKNIPSTGMSLTGWDLAKGSFDLMRVVGTPDPQVQGKEMWRVYAMAYAWTANIGAALGILACLMGWTQTRAFVIVVSALAAGLGITGVAVLFGEDTIGLAPIAWAAGLVDVVLACVALPRAR